MNRADNSLDFMYFVTLIDLESCLGVLELLDDETAVCDDFELLAQNTPDLAASFAQRADNILY